MDTPALRRLAALITTMWLACSVSPLPAQPTQPEAAQFEPIDVTDVVNLATGDFVYTVPLIEVPGPEGSYPIALSYHSGVGPNQQATWVGLGWTLNAGAINRIAEGYPDEYEAAPVYSTYDAKGPKSTAISVGVYYGVPYGSVGLNMSFDVNSGMLGVNASAMVLPVPGGAGAGLSPAVGISAGTSGFGVTGGVNAHAGARSGVGVRVSAGTRGVQGTLSAGYATSPGVRATGSLSAGVQGLSFSGGVAAASATSVGFSMSSSGASARFSRSGYGGGVGITKMGSGNVVSSGFSIPIPLPSGWFVTLGFSQRQWILRQREVDAAFGYAKQNEYLCTTSARDARTTGRNLSGRSRRTACEEVESAKFERRKQGDMLYVSPDNYAVSAQGLSGNFRPFLRRSFELHDGDEGDEKGRVRIDDYHAAPEGSEKPVYRFLNDAGGNLVSSDAEDLTQITYTAGREGLSNRRDRTIEIPGEEWFGARKVEPLYATDEEKNIRSFRVTDPSGKVYTFGRAVRSIFEYSHTKDEDPDLEEPLVKTTTRHVPYPTQWLLTSVRGPDYVDRFPTGMGPEDWGYWVRLSYEETEMPRLWRTPYAGRTVSPVSEDITSYSYGLREEVYLRRIETATHAAEFNRSDAEHRQIPPGREWIDQVPGFFTEEENGFSTFGEQIGLRQWAFRFRGDWTAFIENADPDTQIMGVDNECSGFIEREVLVDDHISKRDVQSYSFSDGYTQITTTTGEFIQDGACAELFVEEFVHRQYMSGQKLETVTLFRRGQSSQPIKTVRFGYDYTLRPSTPGSFADEKQGAEGGTLTLRSVSFEGRGEATIMPPYRFEYAYRSEPGGGHNPAWGKDDWDRWGSYRGQVTSDVGKHMRSQKKDEADRADAWNLTKVTTPTGGTIDVEYESDDYWHVQQVHDIAKTQRLALSSPGGEGNDKWTTRLSISADWLSRNEATDVRIEPGWRVLFLKEGYVTRYEHSASEGGCVDNSHFWPRKRTLPEVRTVEKVSGDREDPVITLSDSVRLEASFSGVREDPNDPCSGHPDREMWSHYLYPIPDHTYGGGVRVRKLTTGSGLDTTRTLYLYERGDGRSSGVASSLPNTHSGPGRLFENIRQSRFREYLDVFITSEKSYGRPSPSVLYSRVDVVNVDADEEPLTGHTRYRFYTANDVPYAASAEGCSSCSFADFSSIYGRPKSTTYFEQSATNNGSTRMRKVKVDSTLYAFGTELSDYGTVKIRTDREKEPIETVPDDAPLGLSQEQYRFVNEDGVQYQYADPENRYTDKPREASMEHRFVNVYPRGSVTQEYTYDGRSGVIENNVRHFLWDARTGNHLATAAQVSDGSATVTRSTPAHWVYQDMARKRLLTQEAQSLTYRPEVLDVTNASALQSYDFAPDDIIAGSVTTWSNAFDVSGDGRVSDEEASVWRKNDTFRYNPVVDGAAGYTPFTGWRAGPQAIYPRVTPSQPWEMTSNVTHYDEHSHPVEWLAEDGSYSAAVYGYEGANVVATAQEARRREIIATSFENLPGSSFAKSLADLRPPFDPQLRKYPRTPPGKRLTRWKTSGAGTFSIVKSIQPAGTSPTAAHQGENYLHVQSSGSTADLRTRLDVAAPDLFRLSVWARGEVRIWLERVSPSMRRRKGPSSTSSVQAEPVATVSGWTLYVAEIRALRALRVRLGVEAGGEAFFDGVRVHPARARVQTFDYDPLTHQVTAITDLNNRTTYFEYDAAGRLVRIRDQEGNLTKRHRYYAAFFTAYVSESDPRTIVLDASESVGAIDGYRWRVGAEEPQTRSAPTRIFGQATPAPVTLELLDAEGRVRAEITKYVDPLSLPGYSQPGREECDDFKVSIWCSPAGDYAACSVNPDIGATEPFEFVWGPPGCNGNTCSVPCEDNVRIDVSVKDSRGQCGEGFSRPLICGGRR